MILMLYLQLACLLSLVLQIVSSKFGLQIKEGQSFCYDFFLLYGVLPPRPRPPASKSNHNRGTLQDSFFLCTVLLCTMIQSMYYIDSISVKSKSLRNWWANIHIIQLMYM